MLTTQAKATPSIDEVYEGWKKQGVRFVICELADLNGMPRSKMIPLSRFKYCAEHGLRMIGATVAIDSGSNVVPETHYLEERNYGDSILRLDLETAAVVPWMENTARVICDPYWPDGEPLHATSRHVLHRVLDELSKLGYTSRVGLEFEFYLLRNLSNREPVFEGLHIFNNARNVAVPVIERIMEIMPGMGIEILTGNCEYGPGQYEITYEAEKGLLAGDQGFTFKTGVKMIARQLGYYATFMTKPFLDQSASGTHVHISLLKENGENAFLASQDQHGLSETAYRFTQGMLKHTPGAMAILAPTPNCYRRFVHHSFAPVNVSWGLDDRTTLVRARNTFDEETHLENRLPTALCNPYLAVAAVIASGILGLQEEERPHAPVHGPAEEHEDFAPLPTTLGQALEALEGDTALRALLGEEFIDIFLKIKRNELTRQQEYTQQQVTRAEVEWEIQEYLADY